MSDVCVLFNPSCSKCRAVKGALSERNVEVDYVEYLDAVPSRAELKDIVRKLGISSPREMMRTGEPVYQQLALHDADDERLIDAMLAHPILIERPIVIRGDRAIIARPPEKLLAFLS